MFREASSNFEEQIMSADKYPSILSSQIEVFVFIILQMFIATRKLGNFTRIFPVLAGQY